jgi:hypothetical protein
VKQEVAVVPPDNLLVSPCNVADSGSTVGSLAQGYIANAACIDQHKASLDALKRWKQTTSNIYNKEKP